MRNFCILTILFVVGSSASIAYSDDDSEPEYAGQFGIALTAWKSGNINETEEILKELSQNNYFPATAALAQFLVIERDDRNAAIDLLLPHASNENADAQRDLGLLLVGQGQSELDSRGIDWLYQAARQHDKGAINILIQAHRDEMWGLENDPEMISALGALRE